ncbi:hypothetical protein DFH07DRAFT_784083 [Mycena maculata]|uniref:Uncharacterized protein n=1 Tax=Mycena maculata TaxID=230809 RepID=A0AAD7HIJ8_9AGAR|nr:hypothetical protein DFH07DRAFT_784083 [Mycena maculata]
MAQIVSGAKIACGVSGKSQLETKEGQRIDKGQTKGRSGFLGAGNLDLPFCEDIVCIWGSTSYKQGWHPKQPSQKLLRLGLDSDEVIGERKGNGAALAELFFARSTLGSSGAKSLNTQHAYACFKDVTGLCGVLSPIHTVYALVFGGTSSFITDPFCSGSNSERDANTEHDTANDGDHKDGTKTQQRPGPDTTYFQARPFGPEGLVLDLVVDASGYIFHSNTQAGGNRHGSAVDNFSRGRKVRATITS